ncbi:uncharacterized protein L969DRAFT_16333 [Mixia osmundae IAM 14324]|uniref:RraA-like protein n=1 Tax=Mixia osmundae (strain CBS 9802 / IAM 14324 / JCM 22182 / KY 12970) TaxID=764103 RepID=G7DU55_MIXOS|nr:uncharacterized protein L969DRAFT_16333 [Mixia osmundae IAM 14324]KEI40981.1 hypothetical protein L969DRAFT_16333 [Mixia osmundae IAM 14324]GAA94115.1 hypothetical protein E5Q_00762 [Mixia osmundae IAM 14324]
MVRRATAEQIAAVGNYSSCEISDALIKLKHPTGGLLPDLDLFSPSLASEKAEQTRIVGEAFTVKMIDAADKDQTKPPEHFVDAAEPGSIMVISAPAHVKSAVWGGLMTARAQARGVKGVIIDGRCRDLGEHRQASMTVFARGHSTLGQSPFTRVKAYQVPLTIQPHLPAHCLTATYDLQSTFQPTSVNPHDIVVGDIDGVVVVSPDRVDEVLKLCEKGRAVDAKCMEDLHKGRSIRETFAAHRGK